jgi:hypothetical protein
MTDSVIMEFLRTVTSRGHRYRQRVEWYRDPTTRRRRLRIVENLGPELPVYRRPILPPTSVPMLPVHFGVLATRMMTGSLTAHQVIETVREMGVEPPREALDAAGIRFDLGEKTLELLLWTRAPSPRPGRVRSAGRPGRSKASARRPSSPSTASDD